MWSWLSIQYFIVVDSFTQFLRSCNHLGAHLFIYCGGCTLEKEPMRNLSILKKLLEV
jgi:hypothetical protein